MKKVTLFALFLTVCGVLYKSVLAQENLGDNSDVDVTIAEDYEGAPRFLVTHVRSRTGTGLDSATAVTVVNQSSQACSVQVAWLRANQPDVPLCTLGPFNVSPGFARTFCSRRLPAGTITECNSACGQPPNADPALQVNSGKAIVSSSAGFDCSLIAVEARVYYTTPNDASILAISNSKILFFGEGNLGF
jgi:hypothetical protein